MASWRNFRSFGFLISAATLAPSNTSAKVLYTTRYSTRSTVCTQPSLLHFMSLFLYMTKLSNPLSILPSRISQIQDISLIIAYPLKARILQVHKTSRRQPHSTIPRVLHSRQLRKGLVIHVCSINKGEVSHTDFWHKDHHEAVLAGEQLLPKTRKQRNKETLLT